MHRHIDVRGSRAGGRANHGQRSLLLPSEKGARCGRGREVDGEEVDDSCSAPFTSILFFISMRAHSWEIRQKDTIDVGKKNDILKKCQANSQSGATSYLTVGWNRRQKRGRRKNVQWLLENENWSSSGTSTWERTFKPERKHETSIEAGCFCREPGTQAVFYFFFFFFFFFFFLFVVDFVIHWNETAKLYFR